jgi:hypothetical protein
VWVQSAEEANGPKREEATEGWRKQIMGSFVIYTLHRILFR